MHNPYSRSLAFFQELTFSQNPNGSFGRSSHNCPEITSFSKRSRCTPYINANVNPLPTEIFGMAVSPQTERYMPVPRQRFTVQEGMFPYRIRHRKLFSDIQSIRAGTSEKIADGLKRRYRRNQLPKIATNSWSCKSLDRKVEKIGIIGSRKLEPDNPRG